jgi:penicillin-binding protein 2
MVARDPLLAGAARVIEGSRTRLTVLGIVVVFLFSALFTRLWFLQVAESTSYTAAATENRVRVVYEPALRGQILDRQGRPLVMNEPVDVVTFDRSAKLSTDEKTLVYARLADVLDTTVKRVKDRIENNTRVSQYAPIPVQIPVSQETRTYIEEHRPEFPGVDVKTMAVRKYPYGSLAAHVLGYVGEINGDELKSHSGEGYHQGDLIGKDGVEEMFESVLRGTPRRLELSVDNQNHVVGVVSDRPAVPGKDVQLTIDLDIQRIAEESLAQGMDGARAYRDYANSATFERFRAGGGSTVVLDSTDGSVVAMASAPTYDPGEFVGGISVEAFQKYKDDPNNPLLNRAIQGLYAPGSTFKLITSIAGLETGQLDPNAPYYDQGCIDLSDGTERCNAGKKKHGTVDLSGALTVSSDVYFYTVGRDMWQSYNTWRQAKEDGQPARDDDIKKGYAIQDTAREYGFGTATGIGLAGEAAGRVPDQQWKEEFNQNVADPRQRLEYSLWLPGDNINLAVGQGDLLVTPLQLASAYLTFVDGGTRYTPRLANALLQPGTASDEPPTPFRALPAQSVQHIEIPPEVRDPIMAGLVGAVGGNGTARGVFSDYALGSVAGKTGTAENKGKQDTSLFVGITPADAPRYVVTTVVEEAGYGSAVAAPISRRIIDGLNGNLEPAPVRVSPPESSDDD